jgi:hypothetical protein
MLLLASEGPVEFVLEQRVSLYGVGEHRRVGRARNGGGLRRASFSDDRRRLKSGSVRLFHHGGRCADLRLLAVSRLRGKDSHSQKSRAGDEKHGDVGFMLLH